MKFSTGVRNQVLVSSSRTIDVIVVITGHIIGGEPECHICITQQEADEYMDSVPHYIGGKRTRRSLYHNMRCEKARLKIPRVFKSMNATFDLELVK